MLCVRQTLTATIHQQKFVDLGLNETVGAAVRDIKDEKFWKCIYVVLRAVFPALCLLRYCDKSTPAMDKIYYLSHRTTIALEKSEEFLNDEALFGEMSNSCNFLYRERSDLGGDSDDDDNDDVLFSNDLTPSSDVGSDDDNDNGNINSEHPKSFGGLFIWHWNKRKLRIEHEYVIVGWVLCVMEDIRKDVVLRMTGVHQLAIERVVTRLHAPPCANTNPAVSSMSIPDILDTFWNEFKAFQLRSDPYDAASCWLSQDVVKGNLYLWHEKYSTHDKDDDDDGDGDEDEDKDNNDDDDNNDDEDKDKDDDDDDDKNDDDEVVFFLNLDLD